MPANLLWVDDIHHGQNNDGEAGLGSRKLLFTWALRSPAESCHFFGGFNGKEAKRLRNRMAGSHQIKRQCEGVVQLPGIADACLAASTSRASRANIWQPGRQLLVCIDVKLEVVVDPSQRQILARCQLPLSFFTVARISLLK